MEFLIATFQGALALLLEPSREIWAAALFSLLVAGLALLLALIAGAPLGAYLALKVLPRRSRLQTAVLGGAIGFPPVLTGLIISLLCWPGEGLLGKILPLHTPAALVITQALICLPIMAGFTVAGIERLSHQLVLKGLALGASPVQLVRLTLWEIRYVLTAALLVSAGRLLSEVGAALMTGGGIPGYTQTLATGIALYTVEKEPERALALGLVLGLALLLFSLLLTFINRRGVRS
ncbi:MAG TPA: ABC transporter permease [Clostridia bacterium]|nr:ABC transporter permease [Clostridia bacterium]